MPKIKFKVKTLVPLTRPIFFPKISQVLYDSYCANGKTGNDLNDLTTGALRHAVHHAEINRLLGFDKVETETTYEVDIENSVDIKNIKSWFYGEDYLALFLEAYDLQSDSYIFKCETRPTVYMLPEIYTVPMYISRLFVYINDVTYDAITAYYTEIIESIHTAINPSLNPAIDVKNRIRLMQNASHVKVIEGTTFIPNNESVTNRFPSEVKYDLSDILHNEIIPELNRCRNINEGRHINHKMS